VAKQIEKNGDFRQLDLPLDIELGKGERILKHTRLLAQSAKCAWYELYLVRLPHGYLIEKISGAQGCGRQRETWFRRHQPDAEKKFEKIISDKTNPDRRSPRKYTVVGPILQPETI
jgi:hypothetical protein